MNCAIQSSLASRSTSSLFAVLLLWSSAATAGWYRVTNYEGHIGPYPVHLSIQEYEFDRGINVNGSYYYDRKRQPIPLYGRRGDKGVLVLCEVHGAAEEKEFIWGSKTTFNASACPFHLASADHSLSGNWTDSAKTYEVSLAQVAALDNTAEELVISGQMEIPYWGQTSRHSFIGIYSREGTEGHAVVRVVNKVTGLTLQELRPNEHGCVFGFVMTPIYMHTVTDASTRVEQIDLLCDSKVKDYVTYKFNKSANRFVRVPDK